MSDASSPLTSGTIRHYDTRAPALGSKSSPLPTCALVFGSRRPDPRLRFDARGFREATLRLTDSAISHGFAAVIPERLKLTVGYGRGERISAVMSDAGAVVRFVRESRASARVRTA